MRVRLTKNAMAKFLAALEAAVNKRLLGPDGGTMPKPVIIGKPWSAPPKTIIGTPWSKPPKK